MSILLAVVGATVGAVVGSVYMHWRTDVTKERQQLESKTPYDYALTNARSDNKRLRDELTTVVATKRLETDNERLRNEIRTIVTEGGDEASESVYELNSKLRDVEAVGKRWERNMKALYGDWEIPKIHDTEDDLGKTVEELTDIKVELEKKQRRLLVESSVKTKDGVLNEHTVSYGETLSQIARKYGVKVWDIVEDNDILIYDDLNAVGVICVGQTLKIRDEGITLEMGEELVRELDGSTYIVNHQTGTLTFVNGADEIENADGSMPILDFGAARIQAASLNCDTINAVEYGEGIPIQQHSDGTVSPILSPYTGMNDEDVKRSLINEVKDKASESVELAVELAKMVVRDDEAIRKQLEETSEELDKEIRTARRGILEFREDEWNGENIRRERR